MMEDMEENEADNDNGTTEWLRSGEGVEGPLFVFFSTSFSSKMWVCITPV